MKKTMIISILILACLFIPKEEKITQAEIKELAVATYKSEQIITDVNSNEVTTLSSRSAEETRVENIEPQIILATNISQAGIDLIKKYEGFSATAYKQNKNEKYFTIGFGHNGSDVKAGQVITEEQAERLLIAEINGIVEHILNNYSYLELNQGELDALTSFTYNCGIGNLNRLTDNKTRTKEEIAEHITAYTKSGSEGNRNGLQKRRNEEQKMFKGI